MNDASKRLPASQQARALLFAGKGTPIDPERKPSVRRSGEDHRKMATVTLVVRGRESVTRQSKRGENQVARADYKKQAALRKAIEGIEGMDSPALSSVVEILIKDYQWIIDWVFDEFDPEDIFNDSQLEMWAINNGHTKEE